MTIRNRYILSHLVKIFVLTCLVFSLSASAQDAADRPMEAKALASLVEELKGVVSRTAPDKNEANRVGEKWDKRSDLAGKTRKEVIDLLYADVESVIKDPGTRYEISSIFSFYKNIGETPQAKAEPRLIDEFQRTNCEGVLARLDGFIVELQNVPDSTGYVVTYGRPHPRRAAEREIKNAVRDKGLDAGRISFAVGGRDGNDARIAFWLVPKGADAPKVTTAGGDDLTIPAKTKPYIFGQSSAGDLGGCSDYDPAFFAETLKANPASRGNIVIYETSRRRFREERKAMLSKLTGSGITRKRLRTFYVRVRSGSLRIGTELWLLP